MDFLANTTSDSLAGLDQYLQREVRCMARFGI